MSSFTPLHNENLIISNRKVQETLANQRKEIERKQREYDENLTSSQPPMPEETVEGEQVGATGQAPGTAVGYGGQEYDPPKTAAEAFHLVRTYVAPTFGDGLKIYPAERTPEKQKELYRAWQVETMRAIREVLPEVAAKNFSDGGPGLDAKELFKTLPGWQRKMVYQEMQGPKQVAPPGKSKHETGEAIDIGVDQYIDPKTGQMSLMGQKIVTELNRLGLYQPSATVQWDPNHFEFFGVQQQQGRASQQRGASGPADTAGLGFEAVQRLSGEFAEGSDAERAAAITRLQQDSLNQRGALVEHSNALQRQINDKNDQERRIVRETFALQEAAAESMAKEEQAWKETSNQLEWKHARVQQTVDGILDNYKKSVKDIERMGQDPRKTFGFVDEKGEWSWSKFGVTIGAAVGFLANALLTVGSKGKIPFIAWRMIDGMIDNDLQNQKVAINSKWSSMNADLTLMGKLRTAFADDKARLLAGKESRLEHTIKYLKHMRAKAALPENTKQAIQILENSANVERTKVGVQLKSSLYDNAYKNLGALSGAIRQEEQTQGELTGMGLRAHQAAESLSRRSLPKWKVRMRVAEEAWPHLRELADLWEKWGRHSNFLNKLGAGYAPELLKTFNSFWGSEARSAALRIQTIAQDLGPKYIRMGGETGNMAISENLRGIRMLPTSDSYEDGVIKIKSMWGFLTLVGNEDFQKLPKESREKLLAHGFSHLPGAGDLTIRSAEHQSRIWQEALDDNFSDNYDSFRQAKQGVTFEELSRDLKGEGRGESE